MQMVRSLAKVWGFILAFHQLNSSCQIFFKIRANTGLNLTKVAILTNQTNFFDSFFYFYNFNNHATIKSQRTKRAERDFNGSQLQKVFQKMANKTVWRKFYHRAHLRTISARNDMWRCVNGSKHRRHLTA